jgi:hypothetical protein
MRIDIHADYWTDGCLGLLADLGKTAAGTLRGPDAGDGQELDSPLRLIGRAARTCRCSPPRRSCLTLMDRVKAVAAARFVNGQYAALAERHAGRFRAFAATPMPYIAARRSPNWDAPWMSLVWNPDRYCRTYAHRSPVRWVLVRGCQHYRRFADSGGVTQFWEKAGCFSSTKEIS